MIRKLKVLAMGTVQYNTYQYVQCYTEAVSDYFLTILAGLAGSAHMVSATLLALSRLVYEFHGILCLYVMHSIIFIANNVSLWLIDGIIISLNLVLLTDLLGAELVKRLLSSTCVFLSSKSREVVRATLEFMKVTIGVLPASELVPHVEDMVSQI